MATVNAANVLMAGSESDSLYLGPAGTDLSTIKDLSTPIPIALTDVGWLSDDGLSLELSDSVDKIRGHQGHGVVRTYMSDSSTTITASLLESKLATIQTYLDATVAQSGASLNKVATISANAARSVKRLTGAVDLFDTSDTKVQFRILFPVLELGERDSISFKVGDATAYSMKLEVIGKFTIITNAPGLIAA